MKTYILRYTFLLALTLFFASCKKNDEVTITKTKLLTAQTWHGKAVLANNIDVSDRQEVKDMFLDIKTMQLTFRADKTYTATFNDNEGSQTITGNWELRDGEQILYFDLTGEFGLAELTNTQLTLVKKMEQNGIQYDAKAIFTTSAE